MRFTAPTTGIYDLSVTFAGADFVGPTTTDVHVLDNGISIFDGSVDGYGPGTGPTFSTGLVLNAGDTIDFAVGYGSNGSNRFDTTAISAQVSNTPEPTTIAMVMSALLVIAGMRLVGRLRRHD